ncbi:MAG TPA: hypothetical protein VGC13_20690 [Longimicrobium sp.]|jgi:hypothetical protein|uniref:hypothetical protein n=1 Tax=Longimicrobium sp. TaxID=2029185 RepID=UPI002EDA711E
MVAVCAAGAGCVKNGAGAAPGSGPSPAAAGATLALDLRNPQEARESIFGDVVLFSAPGMGLALALDGGAQPGMQEGFVDQVFVLQQQTPAAVQPRRPASAELFYAGPMLLVRSGTDRLAWMVRGAGNADPEVDRLPFSASGAERFTGFGLSRRTGAWQVRLENAAGASMTSLLASR